MDKSPNVDSGSRSSDSSGKGSTDSLIKMFSSPYFTMDLALIYLYKHRRDKGIFDYLVNKLYAYNDSDIEYYLPQLM